MALRKRRYGKEEFARRGDAIYQNQVRPRLHAADEGKFVAIDIETGEFEVNAEELLACDKMHARLPNAQIWMVRIGSSHVHRFGGQSRRIKP